MGFEVWHIWIIAAILLFIAEIFTVTFFLLSLGVACIASAVASFYGMNFEKQIVVFCVSMLVVFFGARPFFQKYVYGAGAKFRTNVEALVGATGMVLKRIDPKKLNGRVAVMGDDWRALSADNTPIEAGEKVVVVKVEGTKVFVRPE
jgi:membrane protein implicated in regulation of membrane protease activity